ncbi:MAG TPA: hypothetical protein VF257_01435 [Solirubrobacteraceae bacterium]
MPARRGLVLNDRRAVRRDLSRLDGHSQFELARVERMADLQAARVDALGYVGQRALQEMALVSQFEQELAALVPGASGRLQAIGDLTALAMADVVSETARRLRR